MSEVTIIPSPLCGEVITPPSKSVCHRAVICAGLAKGTSIIDHVELSDDISATIGGISALGAEITQGNGQLVINGIDNITPKNSIIECGESGSTLRFLIPIALSDVQMTFTGKGKLVERPLDSYFSIFTEQHILYDTLGGHLPLSIKGALKPGKFHLRGDISSQFISGLLFALPRLNADSTITITTELESYDYVNLTIAMLARFGINIENNMYREFFIPGKQQYQNTNYRVEGDFSQAAFWLVAGTLGMPVTCLGLNMSSLQGDKAIIPIIRQMGGKITVEADAATAHPSPTAGIEIDASQCPDLVPILTVLGSVSDGITRIVRAGRLRMKESDRLRAITEELNKLGADIHENRDSLTIYGRSSLQGGIVDSWNDHRIAMALAIASIKCHEPVTIKNSQCVNKSYPRFWNDFRMLTGNITVHNIK